MLVNYNDYKDGGSHKSFTISVVGENITVTNENMRQDSITLDEALCSERNLRFGCCESSQFSVHIANVFENFEGKQIQVSVTMDNKTTKYGTFKVKSDKPTADRIHRKLVAYDAMNDIINTNVLTWFKGLTFPITLKNFRDSFFSYLGITQETRTLINDDFVILGGFTASDSLSGRLIITSICELNGVFGHINRDGKFDYIDLTASSSFDCPPYENNSVKYEDYVTSAITKVTMRGTASDVGTSVGTDGNEYIIQGNPLIYGSEGKPALVTAMTRLLNKIKNVVFRPFELGKTIGNPCVELGDAISIETKYETIESYVLRRTLTGIQALRDKYSAEGDDVYPAGVSILQDEISRTKGKMLEIESSVDGLRIIAEEISEDLDENYYNKTEIDQTVEEITLAASQTYTEKSNAIKTDTLYYLATSAGSNVDRDTPGWTTTIQNMTATNKYLWTYHLYTYDDGHTSPTDPVITGRWGDSGGTTAVYELQLSSAAINKSATANSYTPSTFALSAYYQVGTSAPTSYFGRFKIETTNDNSTWVAHYISSSDESYKAFTIPTTISGLKLIRCSLYMAGGTTTLLDQQTIPIVTDGSKGDKGDTGEKGDKGIKGDTGSPGAKGDKGDTGNAGADAYTVILANENHTFAGSNTAAIAASTECPVIAYKGSFQVPATIGTITGQPTGMTTTISYNGTINSRFSVEVTTSMVSKNGVLNVPVEVDGKTFNMKFTYSLALKGDTGTAARRYDLIVSNAAIGKDQSGNYNPASITLTAKYQDGTSSPANYSGRFKIETTTDNSTWTTTYTSSSNEYTKSYTIPANIIAVRCSLYLAGGTTTLLDQQTIPIVVDGANGAKGDKGNTGDAGKDAYTVILTNENHTFAGSATAAIAGSTECAVVAYKGATQVAATIGTISGQPTGMTTSISNNGTTSAKFTVTVTTQMVTKNGVLTVPVTVDGKTFSMKFTYSLALKGDIGDTGTSITEVTPIRYTSNSTTAPSKPTSEVTRTDTATGVWTKGIPALTNTYKYMYTCDQVKYDNNTIEWTTVVRDNALTNLTERVSQAELKITPDAIVATVEESNTFTTVDDFNALEIGGRNLCQKTTEDWKSKTLTGVNNESIAVNGDKYYTSYPIDAIGIGLKTNDILQISFDIKFSSNFAPVSGQTQAQRIQCTCNDGGTWSGVAMTGSNLSSEILTIINSSSKEGHVNTYMKVPAKMVDGTTNGMTMFSIRFDYWTGTVYLKNVMVEKASKPSSWSPAPEDAPNYTDAKVNSISIGGTQMLWDTNVGSTSKVDAPLDKYIESTSTAGYSYTFDELTSGTAPSNGIKYAYHLVQTNTSAKHALVFYSNNTAIKLISGNEYTVSVYCKWISGTDAKRIALQVYDGVSQTVNRRDIIQDGKWHQYSYTFTANDNMASNGFRFYGGGLTTSSNGNVVYEAMFCGWKLEAGNKATAWSEHPDHYGSKSEITQLSNKIVMKVKSNGEIVTCALSADASTGTAFTVKAANIDLTASQAIHLMSGGTLNLSSETISIDTTNHVFQVTSAGAVTCSNITATGGTIGGWNIQSTALEKFYNVSNVLKYRSFLNGSPQSESDIAFAVQRWDRVSPSSVGWITMDMFSVNYEGIARMRSAIMEYGIELAYRSSEGEYSVPRSFVDTSSGATDGMLSIYGMYYKAIDVYNAISSQTTSYIELYPKVKCDTGLVVLGVDGDTELKQGGIDLSHATPFIDFHLAKSSDDYTARIYQTIANTLDFKGGNAGTWGTLRAASFSVQSSKHVKKNIKNITEAEAKKILDLRPVSFDYKYDTRNNQRGLIAEEVLDIMPEMVNVPEGYTGFDKNDFDNVPGIDYSKFVPYLIKMIQIQQKEIDSLKK